MNVHLALAARPPWRLAPRDRARYANWRTGGGGRGGVGILKTRAPGVASLAGEVDQRPVRFVRSADTDRPTWAPYEDGPVRAPCPPGRTVAGRCTREPAPLS